MLEALGGRDRWAAIASLYIQAVHTEPHLDRPYRSEIWRDVGTRRVRIVQQGTRDGEPFHSVRLLVGDDAWSVRDGVAQPMSDVAREALFHWDAHLYYAALQTLARGGPGVEVRVGGDGGLVLYRGGVLVGRFILDDHHRPVEYVTPTADGEGESVVRYTEWAETEGYVYPVVSRPSTGAVFRAEAWQPSERPSAASFSPDAVRSSND